MLDPDEIRIANHQIEQTVEALGDLARLFGGNGTATHAIVRDKTIWVGPDGSDVAYPRKGCTVRSEKETLCLCSGEKIGEIIANVYNAKSARVELDYNGSYIESDGWRVEALDKERAAKESK